MRTIVIVRQRGVGYVADVTTPAKQWGGQRIGLTPYDAAAGAARLMLAHAQSNAAGGELMAPPEVMEHVPEALRAVPARG